MAKTYYKKITYKKRCRKCREYFLVGYNGADGLSMYCKKCRRY